MTTSLRASLLAALLVTSAAPVAAQMNAEAMVRATLRSSLGELDVQRGYRILTKRLHQENGLDITEAHAVPRSQQANALYQATFRNVSGPVLCARFKVVYEDDAYHDPQFIASNRDNHLVAPGTHLGLLAVWGEIQGQSFLTPTWRLGYWFWEPAASGERRCDSAAPSDLDAWIDSAYDTYPEFKRMGRQP